MLIEWNKITNFYIACGYTDMRKQIDGSAAIVQLKFGMELDEQSPFLFCGRKEDRIKALYWDGTGFIPPLQTNGKSRIQMAQKPK